MLRICYSSTNPLERWMLCGQLAGPWVKELRSCWEHARSKAAASGLVIDLSDVTFIDESGEKLLAEMRREGAHLFATGIETKHLIENLKPNGEKTLRRLI